MKFVVDESTWCRGGKNLSSDGESCLLTDKDTQCCLGFRLCASRIPPSRLSCLGMPSHVRHKNVPKYLLEFVTEKDIELAESYGLSKYDLSRVEDIFTAVNDNQEITDIKRQNILTKLFAAYGDEVVFKKGTSRTGASLAKKTAKKTAKKR